MAGDCVTQVIVLVQLAAYSVFRIGDSVVVLIFCSRGSLRVAQTKDFNRNSTRIVALVRSIAYTKIDETLKEYCY